MVAAGAAVLLVDRQTQEADLAELFDDRPVDFLGAVPGDDVRGDLALHEVPRELPDRALLLAELQIHHRSPH
jgi:hypothetical protein